MIDYLKTFKPVDFTSTARLLVTLIFTFVMFFFVFTIFTLFASSDSNSIMSGMKYSLLKSILFSIYEVVLIDLAFGIGREHYRLGYSFVYIFFNIFSSLLFL